MLDGLKGEEFSETEKETDKGGGYDMIRME